MFAARLTLLIGPAGTGKTTLLEALVSLAEVKDHGVLLLAPTGKARVVLAEHTGVQAETIAQALLRVERYDPATGAYALRGKAPYLEGYRTVIIDECSMLTESQLVATLDALRGVQRLILVGDPRQLPPIGAGRPFVDLVRHVRTSVEGDLGKEPFPRVAQGYAELTVIRRQASEHTSDDPIERDDVILASWFAGDTADPASTKCGAGSPPAAVSRSWSGRRQTSSSAFFSRL